MTKIQIKHTQKIKTQGKQTNNIFNMYHRKKSIAEYEKNLLNHLLETYLYNRSCTQRKQQYKRCEYLIPMA